jgi:DNA-binding transcriptional ArsR family regulator
MSTIDQSTLAYEADDTLIVTDPVQLRAVGDELRSRIVSLLRERAWSTQQLARELGLPKGTIGHHLKVLERARLIHVVHTRQVRGVTEKFYGRVARLFLFHVEDPADARTLGASALRDAAFQMERAHENATWGFPIARLTPEAADRFERRLKRLIDDFHQADVPGESTFRLAVALWGTEGTHA